VTLQNGQSNRKKFLNLAFVWPCIISIDCKEESQLDATITVYQ
jgi:hypothetical protein